MANENVSSEEEIGGAPATGDEPIRAPARIGYPWPHRLLLALYDLVWLFAIGGWLLYRGLAFSWLGREGIAHRLGKVPQRPAGFSRSLWIHAVSVGEIISVKPLIAAIKKAHPDWWILLSTNERHAWSLAQQGVGADAVCKVPWDASWCIRRALRRSGADTLVLVECELWPNMIVRAADAGCELVMMNARIYERDHKSYRRMRWFFAPIVRQIGLIGCQSEPDRARFIELGASACRAVAMGNTKFDVPLPPDIQNRLQALRHLRASDRALWVLASTHANEEELIFQSLAAQRGAWPKLQMLVAPRHPSRAGEVKALAKSADLSAELRSQITLGQNVEEIDVIILDTIGELPTLLALADVVFVGGSLVELGGHNVIEPALHSKAILTGPSLYNFREIIDAFLAADAIVRVNDVQELLKRTRELLAQAEARDQLGKRASDVVAAQAGCIARWITALESKSAHQSNPTGASSEGFAAAKQSSGSSLAG